MVVDWEFLKLHVMYHPVTKINVLKFKLKNPPLSNFQTNFFWNKIISFKLIKGKLDSIFDGPAPNSRSFTEMSN